MTSQEAIEREGVDPTKYIRWYNLRGYDRINAPKSFIKKMEQQSGVQFHEAQVALAKIWVGGMDIGEQKDVDKVDIKVAQDEHGVVGQLEDPGSGASRASTLVNLSTSWSILTFLCHLQGTRSSRSRFQKRSRRLRGSDLRFSCKSNNRRTLGLILSF